MIARQKLKISKIFVCMLAVLTLTVSAMITRDMKITVDADTVSVANGTETMWGASYKQGDIFTMPADVKITDSGAEYAASVVLRDPDLNGYSSSETVLKKIGRYTLEYRAAGAAGKPLMAKQYFNCNGPLYSVSSAKSSAAYSEEPVSYTGIEKTAPFGILAEIAAQNTFYYNKPIDLSECVKDDPFLSFYVAPRKIYNNDVSRIIITLTDQFDPANYVTLTFKRTILVDTVAMDRYSYITANAAGQPAVGLEEHSNNGNFAWGGKNNYILHKNDIYGTKVMVSMNGAPDPVIYNPSYQYYGNPSSTYLFDEYKLTYDAANKTFYVIDSEVNPAFGDASKGTPLPIAALSDPSIFGENLWKGFTADKVYMSVSGLLYNELTAGVVFTDINGDNLAAESFADDVVPELTIDYQDYSAHTVPKAAVGYKYPIFNATAYDGIDGIVPVSASVWYNYYSDGKARITLNDGKFIPPYKGTYTVVYSASDKSGNIGQKFLDIYADALELITFDLADDATASPAAGKVYRAKTPDVSGGTGHLSLKVTAVHKTRTDVSYDLTDTGGSFSFVPLYSGNYTITYKCSDYLGTQESSYDVNVANAAGAYIADEAVVPRYFIKGAVHGLSNLYGFVFADGAPVAAKCGIKISQDNGTPENAGADGRVTITADSTVKVIYTLEMSGGAPAVKEYTVPVISDTGLGETDGDGVSLLSMEKYFVNTGRTYLDAAYDYEKQDIAIGSTANDITLSLSPAGAAKRTYGAVEFIRPVLAQSFNLEFRLMNTGFRRVSIILTDSEDQSVQLKATYSYADSAVSFSINNGYDYATSLGAGDALQLKYSADNLQISEASAGVSIAPAYGLNGNAFKGFASGLVYVNIQIEGVDNGAAGSISINKLNTYSLNGSAGAVSFSAPEITAFMGGGGYRYINSNVTLPGMLTNDIFDPYTTLVMEVKAPDNSIVLSTAGVALNNSADPYQSHSIVLSQYGNYTVTYVGTNINDGRVKTYSFTFSVRDLIPPEVAITPAAVTAGTGETITTPVPSVSDDRSAINKISVTVYVKAPSGTLTKLGSFAGDAPKGFAFTPTAAGTYKIMYYVADESGNVTVAGYVLTVS